MIIAPLLAALLAVPAAAGPAERLPFTPGQLARLVEGIDEQGSSNVPGPELCAALGLKEDPKNPYRIKYPSRVDAPKGGPERMFGRSKETGDYLLVVTTKARKYYFRMGADLKLAGWASYKLRGDLLPLDPVDADLLFKREAAFWAEWVDKK